MVNDGYFWIEAISVVLLITAFIILLNAKRRDITNFLKNKLAGIFFLVVIFLIVFIVGFFISALSILAFIVSFILLLTGFVFSKRVEMRRGLRIFKGKFEEENPGQCEGVPFSLREVPDCRATPCFSRRE